MEERQYIYVSYDTVFKALSFYNPTTKNRMTINKSNLMQLPKLIGNIKSTKKFTFCYPEKSNDIIRIIEIANNLNKEFQDKHVTTLFVAWDNIWKYIKE